MLATLLLKVLFSDKNQSGVITRKYEVRDRQEDLIHVGNLYSGPQLTVEVTIKMAREIEVGSPSRGRVAFQLEHL